MVIYLDVNEHEAYATLTRNMDFNTGEEELLPHMTRIKLLMLTDEVEDGDDTRI